MNDLPNYFPVGWNRRLAGLDYNNSRSKQLRVVFQDFGSLGQVDVDNDSCESAGKPVFLAQRQSKAILTLKGPQLPVLPLSSKPVEG
jgi:hypothetical protein